MPRTAAEWHDVLDTYITQLAWTYHDFVELVEVHMINLETKFKEIKYEMSRVTHIQKRLVKQNNNISHSTAKLKVQMKLGKVVLATYKDIEAFELAVRNRRAKLRVAKMRKKRKPGIQPTEEFINAVMPNLQSPGTESN